MVLQSISDTLTRSVFYWRPHVPYFKPVRKEPRSSLRIAVLVGERLYHGLKYEADLLLLTPSNWHNVILYGKPDLILVESCPASVSRDWHRAQCTSSEERDILSEALLLAQKNGIPTCYWDTRNFRSFETYKQYATQFDTVFCADRHAVAAFRSQGLTAEFLPPAVQPALFNPFRHCDQAGAPSLGILYDGLLDLERFANELHILHDLKKFGLAIIESRYKLLRRRVAKLKSLSGNILGCVTLQSRVTALRHAEAAIMLEPTLANSLTRQWMALEMAACRVPVLCTEKIAAGDIRKNIVSEHLSGAELYDQLAVFRDDELYREKLAHAAWRKIALGHTFAHRLQTLCQRIGLDFGWQEWPLVTVLCGSNRSDKLLRIITMFKAQTYPEKELVLVYNGPPLSSETERSLRNRCDGSMELVCAPEEITLAAAINIGVQQAAGQYCFKMDDDDLYGENYLLDMMLHARAVDPDVFGKSQSRFTYFESNDSYFYTAHEARPHLCVIPLAHPAYPAKMYVSGNTIAAKTEIFRRNPWEERKAQGADNLFLAGLDDPRTVVATVDRFNMAVERRADLSTHTWQASEKELQRNSSLVAIGRESDCYRV